MGILGRMRRFIRGCEVYFLWRRGYGKNRPSALLGTGAGRRGPRRVFGFAVFFLTAKAQRVCGGGGMPSLCL